MEKNGLVPTRLCFCRGIRRRVDREEKEDDDDDDDDDDDASRGDANDGGGERMHRGGALQSDWWVEKVGAWDA